MLNPIDNKQRGIGRSFQFSGRMGSKAFLERDASHEDFEKLFGENELSEAQMKDLKMDPYSKSFLLCINCEHRMGIVESYFNDNVFEKISLPDNEFIESAKNSNNLIIRLFFLSMIWRASAAEFDNFSFPIEIEMKLRNILDESIGNDLNETIDLSNANTQRIIQEGIFCCTTRVFCDITANQITIIGNDTPYYFEINEYSVCYFPSGIGFELKQNLFGLEKYVNDSTLNVNEEQFQICLAKSSDWNLKRKQLFQYVASKFTEHLRNTYVTLYKQKYARIPALDSIIGFMNELVHGADTITALRYTDKRIDSLIEKHINDG